MEFIEKLSNMLGENESDNNSRIAILKRKQIQHRALSAAEIAEVQRLSDSVKARQGAIDALVRSQKQTNSPHTDAPTRVEGDNNVTNLIESLKTNRQILRSRAAAIVDKADAEKRTELTEAEDAEFRDIQKQLPQFDERIADLEAEKTRADEIAKNTERFRNGGARTAGTAGAWASRAAAQIGAAHRESRAVTSGSIDVPSLVETGVIRNPHPVRLLDLLVNRIPLEGNAYEYYRQTVRTNNAATVADGATKPTSTFTVAAIEDRARVVAHLSQPLPIRVLQDSDAILQWLESELGEGVLNSLETQIISGDGTGENFTGILEVAGTTAVAYATDVVTTLRKARTALQAKNERPNAALPT